jgi:hypothetical protein
MWDERRQPLIASASLMTRYAVSHGLDLDTARNLAPARYDRNAADHAKERGTVIRGKRRWMAFARAVQEVFW